MNVAVVPWIREHLQNESAEVEVPIYWSRILPHHWIVFVKAPQPTGYSRAVGVPDTGSGQPTIDVNISLRSIKLAVGLGPLATTIRAAAMAHRPSEFDRPPEGLFL